MLGAIVGDIIGSVHEFEVTKHISFPLFSAHTLVCITGGIAAPFYGGVPKEIIAPALTLLAPQLENVVIRFAERFGVVMVKE